MPRAGALRRVRGARAGDDAKPAAGRRARGAQGLNLRGLFWLALAVLGTLPLFRLGFEGLAEAWARPEFSHGPVIPVLSFYMFLRELKAVPPVPEPVAGRWPGVALIGLALLVAVAGNLAGIDHLVFYALIVWVAGLVLVGFGWARGRRFWPSVLHLVFMLPLPQFLYWKLSTALQLVSSGVGVELVRAAGVPVFLDGNIIDLGIYKLQVAEACSGLRYLFPIMSFTYVFAVLYRGAVWHKLVLLLSAVPLAIAMNAVRIGVIGILVDRYGIAQAEGFLHVFEGWVIFLACIAILFGMAKAMQRLSGDRRPLGEALELDFSGLGRQLARVRDVVPSPALIAAACLTLAISAAWLAAPPRAAAAPEREPFALFPAELGGWSGVQGALAPDVEASLGADDYLSAWFREPGRDARRRPVPDLLRGADRRRGDPLARGLPARRRLGGLGDPGGAGRARRHGPRPVRGQPGGDPEGAREAARLLLVRRPRPAPDQRLRRQALHGGRRRREGPHRRRAGAGDHADRRRRRGRGRRAPAGLPRRARRPPAPLHPLKARAVPGP